MKNKKIIIAIVAVFLVLAGALSVWLLTKKKADKSLVTFAVDGYNIATTMRLPKEKFTYEINTKESEMFPSMLIQDNAKTYNLKLRLRKLTDGGKQSELKSAKKEGFAEEAANDKTKSPARYTFKSTWSERTVRFDLLKRDGLNYMLDMEIENDADVRKVEDVYNNKDVQDLIKSVRLKANYQATERDYITDRENLMKIKKLANEIDGYKIEQKSSENNKLTMTAVKEIDGSDGKSKKKVGASVEVTVVTRHKNIDAAIADDYFVKKGTRQYNQSANYAGLTFKHNQPEKFALYDHTFFFYAQKDHAVLNGSFEYSRPEDKAIFDKLAEAMFNNLTLNEVKIKGATN